MNRQRVPFILFALGVALVVVAMIWSLQSFADVGRVVGRQGLRPPHSIQCMVFSGGRCQLLAAAHAEKGTLAYMPVLFWLGVLSVLASFWLNLRAMAPGEAWGDRLQRLLIPVDEVSKIVGHFFAWAILLLTAAVSYEVFSRYVLGQPTAWAFDVSYILYGALFIMAGSYALSRNAHVRGDFLYRAWSVKTQAGMDLTLYILFFFPAIVAFIYAGYGFAAQSWMNMERSAFSPAGPPIYHYKTLIPITGVFLLLQGVVEVVRCLVALRTGAWPQRLHDVEELEKIILDQHADDGATAK